MKKKNKKKHLSGTIIVWCRGKNIYRFISFIKTLYLHIFLQLRMLMIMLYTDKVYTILNPWVQPIGSFALTGSNEGGKYMLK